MEKGRGIPPRLMLLLLLAFPGGAWAAGALSIPQTVIGFASPPVAVEALGMGNAVVADGTLFNASAFNPALLANQSDFFEGHLGFNTSNDILGMVNYLTGSGTLDNLQNSLQNVNGYFQNYNSALQSFGAGNINSGSVSQFNYGSSGVQSAVNNINQALNNATDKTIQVGAGLSLAIKIDDHLGFQAYNTTEAAIQVGRGSLVQSLLTLKSLPTMSGATTIAAAQASVSFYYVTQPIINEFLSSQQAQSLQTAANNLQSAINGGNNNTILAAMASYSNSVNAALTSISDNTAEKTLFNNIAPVDVLTYSDTVLMGTYCLRPLDEDKSFSVGVNLKAINRRLAAVDSPYLSAQNNPNFNSVGDQIKDDIDQTTWRWGADLGVLYEFTDPKIKVGASATDFLHDTASINSTPGNPLYGVVTDPAPTDIRVGVSYKPIRELTLNGDVDDLLNNTTYYQGLNYLYHVDFGFNYDLIHLFQFRGGITNGNLCGGIGFLQFLQYAYAVSSLTQSYNHYLQFDLAF